MSEKLVIVRGVEKGRQYELSETRMTIGSDTACSIPVQDEGVAGSHAVVEKENGVWTLRPVSADSPVRIEDHPIQEMRLEHGMVFQVGRAHLRFATARAAIEINPIVGEGFESQEEAVGKLRLARDQIEEQVSSIIIGQKEVLNQILVALFARGHCLIIGVPGLAKTLMVRVLSGVLDLEGKRIQFTPDLMPSDITGTDILEEDSVTRTRQFRFNRGPLFTNVLLADEINRTPPKTQAALLEAMQERRVTTAGTTYDLPQPFLVLATQNPIEQEGTYPLPEAQLDRFMFCIHINYPNAEDEQRILLETTRDSHWEVDRLLDAETILRFQHLVRQVPVSDHVALYASELIRATRPGEPEAPEFVSRWVRWGAGTRAGQYLLLAAKAHVLLNGRTNVSCADVREYALPVLRHRIFANFTAASEGVTTDDIVNQILDHVKEPEY